MITYLISNDFPLHDALLVAAVLQGPLKKLLPIIIIQGEIFQKFPLKINQCKQIQILTDT